MTQLVTLTDEVREALPNIHAHAAACGRLDCGHLGKSSQRAVRRAVFLYQCEGAGMTVDLARVSADVAAVVGVLRESRHARTVYVRGTLASGNRGYVPAVAGMTTVMPNPWGLRLTVQRREVLADFLAGYSATDIAERQHRALETVKSHAGWIRRDTGAHALTDAMIALLMAGRITDRALTVPDDLTIPEPTPTV